MARCWTSPERHSASTSVVVYASCEPVVDYSGGGRIRSGDPTGNPSVVQARQHA
jgi:hypothetical protein